MKAVRIHETGGPEVLRPEEVPEPAPGPGEALVRHRAIGVNFVDCYQRSGLYKVPLPAILGQEGAGRVEAVGSGVTEVKPGDRVAYAGGPPGGYAELRSMPAARLVKLPAEIPETKAAAIMLKGMTAEYLLRRTHPVQKGETVVFHAAAGGVGTIAVQWARALGARVIGVVGSEAKKARALELGCHEVIVSTKEDLATRVKELTGGKGVPVVYDSVGKDTFEGSLRSLAPRGLLVSFGNASGPPPPFDLRRLTELGSLYVTRPTLATYTASRADLLASAEALFGVVKNGTVKIEEPRTAPLAEAASVHRDLEGRRTTGSIVLIPEA